MNHLYQLIRLGDDTNLWVLHWVDQTVDTATGPFDYEDLAEGIRELASNERSMVLHNWIGHQTYTDDDAREIADQGYLLHEEWQ